MSTNTAEKIVVGGNASAHPYYPQTAAMADFVANETHSAVLVLLFMVGVVTIFGATHILIERVRPRMPLADYLVAMWFVLCGFIHLFFEGYFSVNSLNNLGSKQDVFGQLWKEYSLSDSRYLTKDPFLVPMETVTAFLWGPMSFACAYCIVKENPLRWSLQIIISVGQMYGCILYFGTCILAELVAEISYCRPERLYYWFYYVHFNAWWLAIPGYLIWQSANASTAAVAKVKAMEKAGNKKSQ